MEELTWLREFFIRNRDCSVLSYSLFVLLAIARTTWSIPLVSSRLLLGGGSIIDIREVSLLNFAPSFLCNLDTLSCLIVFI